MAQKNLTHGDSIQGKKTTEYISYQGAKARCSNPKAKDFPRYGGRGIEFRFTSYEQFFGAVGRKPSPEHSIDRYPNNDGHYEPGNVRWATKKQQANNRRKPRRTA